MKRRGTRKSFTLIELLIVIAIIAIASAFILITVKKAQSRARDTQRAADLIAIDEAIKFYYRETGHYPSLPAGCGVYSAAYGGWVNKISSDVVDRWATGNCLTPNYIQNIVPSYISKIPLDAGPKTYQSGKQIRGYVYFHSHANTGGLECYKILAFNPEAAKLTQYKDLWDPARDGGVDSNILDGSAPWGWAKYSKGCETK